MAITLLLSSTNSANIRAPEPATTASTIESATTTASDRDKHGKHGIIEQDDRSVACGGNGIHENITNSLLLSHQLGMVPMIVK